MEFTREIYWNVGHGVTTLLPMYLLTVAAIAIMVNAFVKRIKVYKQGQAVNRLDQLPVRILNLVKSVLLQSKVVRVKGPGLAHGLFFWGFFLLFLGTCLIVVQADFTYNFTVAFGELLGAIGVSIPGIAMTPSATKRLETSASPAPPC